MFVAARVSDHPRGMGLCGLLWTSTAFGVRRGLSVSLQTTTTSATGARRFQDSITRFVHTGTGPSRHSRFCRQGRRGAIHYLLIPIYEGMCVASASSQVISCAVNRVPREYI